MSNAAKLRAVAGLALLVLAGVATGSGPARGAGEFTPLHEAAILGDAAKVRALLAGGADANARGEEGVTPLHFAAARKMLPALLEVYAKGSGDRLPAIVRDGTGDSAAPIRALLAAGAKVNARAENEWTPLHVAAVSGDTAAVRSLLGGGANVKARAEGETTPLHFAAISGDDAAIRALLAGGADANARAEGGFTPLHLLAMKKMLLAALQADAEGGRDELLRDIARSFGVASEADRAVFAAALGLGAGNPTGAFRALLGGGANVNVRAEGEITPLHFAAVSGDATAVKALLDAGGNPNAVSYGCGPMDMARLRMESTESSILPFRESIAALQAAGARPRGGCKL